MKIQQLKNNVRDLLTEQQRKDLTETQIATLEQTLDCAPEIPEFHIELEEATPEQFKAENTYYSERDVDRRIKSLDEGDQLYKQTNSSASYSEFYVIRKKYLQSFSMMACIHSGGFAPVAYVVKNDKLCVWRNKEVFGKGKSLKNCKESREFIARSPYKIWTADI